MAQPIPANLLPTLYTMYAFFALAVIVIPGFMIYQRLKYSTRCFIFIPHGKGYRQRVMYGTDTYDRKTGTSAGFKIQGYTKYDGHPVPQDYRMSFKLIMRTVDAVHGVMDKEGNIAWVKVRPMLNVGPDGLQLLSKDGKKQLKDGDLEIFGLSNIGAKYQLQNIEDAHHLWQERKETFERLMPLLLVIGMIIVAIIQGVAAYSNHRTAQAFERASSAMGGAADKLAQVFYLTATNNTKSNQSVSILTPFNNVIDASQNG